MRTIETRRGELHGIQMLRAAAALAVVGHHALEEASAPRALAPDWAVMLGAAGVDVFFVISGFIMFYTAFRPDRPPMRPADFLNRRVTRIYPLYWLCCAVVLALSSVGMFSSHKWTTGDVVSSLALLPSSSMLLTVSWTLVLEMYFYGLFAASLFLRSRAASVLGVGAVIVGLQALAPHLPGSEVANYLGYAVSLEFVMGLGLAWAYMRGLPAWLSHWGWALAGIAVMAVAPTFLAYKDTGGLWDWPRVAAWGVPSLLIVAAALRLGPPAGLAGRLAVLLGDASYAIYLSHGFVMLAYAKALRAVPGFADLGQVPFFLAAVGVSALGGVAIHLVVEKPLLNLVRRGLHRFGPRRTAKPAADLLGAPQTF